MLIIDLRSEEEFEQGHVPGCAPPVYSIAQQLQAFGAVTPCGLRCSSRPAHGCRQGKETLPKFSAAPSVSLEREDFTGWRISPHRAVHVPFDRLSDMVRGISQQRRVLHPLVICVVSAQFVSVQELSGGPVSRGAPFVSFRLSRYDQAPLTRRGMQMLLLRALRGAWLPRLPCGCRRFSALSELWRSGGGCCRTLQRGCRWRRERVCNDNADS